VCNQWSSRVLRKLEGCRRGSCIRFSHGKGSRIGITSLLCKQRTQCRRLPAVIQPRVSLLCRDVWLENRKEGDEVKAHLDETYGSRFPHTRGNVYPSAAPSTLLRNLQVYGTATGQKHDTSLLAGWIRPFPNERVGPCIVIVHPHCQPCQSRNLACHFCSGWPVS